MSFIETLHARHWKVLWEINYWYQKPNWIVNGSAAKRMRMHGVHIAGKCYLNECCFGLAKPKIVATDSILDRHSFIIALHWTIGWTTYYGYIIWQYIVNNYYKYIKKVTPSPTSSWLLESFVVFRLQAASYSPKRIEKPYKTAVHTVSHHSRLFHVPSVHVP